MKILPKFRSTGIKNFSKLLSANIIAQIIGLIVYPILTRMYSPEDFGLLNLFLSISGVLVILSTAEYYNAIVLPKEEEKAISLVQVCLLLLFSITGVTTISVFFSEQIAFLFNTPKLADYYWMMPIIVLTLGVWNILNYWHTRNTQYNSISSYLISNSILSSGGKICFGYAGILSGGMIYSSVIAPIISLFFNLLRIKNKLKLFFTFSWIEIKLEAKKYKFFPTYSLPRCFINMLAGQLPILLLTPIFGSHYVGLWGMALLLGFTPINVITRSIYQVLYQYTTERVNQKQPIGDVFKHFTIAVLSVGIPFFTLLYWILPNLTTFLLGEGWEPTSTYLRWMLPWLLCSILTSSISFLADIFFKQKIGFRFELLTTILRSIGVFTGIWLADFTISIIGYTIGTAIAIIPQYIWLISLVRKYDSNL